MKVGDFPFIIRLTEKERWGFGVTDLRRMLALEPRGCLAAVIEQRTVGLTTAISYGNKLGWIGNVVVDETHRGTGIGATLVESAIRYLLSRHVEAVGLNSYPENKTMYERLGFRPTGGFVRLSIRRHFRRPASKLRGIPLRQILKLDGEIFGADRTRLLRRLFREFPTGWTWILKESGVSGYSVVKQYRDSSEIGPSVCQQMTQENVRGLLQSSIELARKWPLEVSVPESNQVVLDTACGLGFRKIRRGLVMSLSCLHEVTVSPGIAAFGFLDKG